MGTSKHHLSHYAAGLTLAAVCLSLAVTVWGGSNPSSDNGNASAIYNSSFHALHDWNDKQSLSQWKGKYLVLNFWATWCKSCHHEVPELNSLYHKFNGPNTAVVGVAVDNTDKVREYIQHYGVDYPILVGGDAALELSHQLGNDIEGLPYTVVITPQGEVTKTILGATKKGQLVKDLTPILRSSQNTES